MEEGIGGYQKLQPKQYPPRSLRETPEGKFWKRFKAPVVAKQFGAVNHIDFCQEHPYDFAITASTRVIVYNGLTREVKRTFSRFKDKAYSGCFRQDGKLLVAGGEDGVVQIFETSSRTVLRQLKEHKRAVHVARFSPDKVHVLSGSDDVTVRWWDLATGEQLSRMDGHTDYVRAGAVNPTSMDIWATGGYDHICKLWDLRSAECTMTLDHGAPIEDLQFFPSGAMAVTAGGSHLCVWDILSGGKLVKKLPNFQKTVTCVTLSNMQRHTSGASPRLLAGSLDGHLKIFELDNFKVTHASKYPASILSLGLAADCGLLAVGLSDYTLVTRKHMRSTKDTEDRGAVGQGQSRRAGGLTASNYRYVLRGTNEKAAADDYKVEKQRRVRLAPYDKLLKKFRYRDALDAALATRHPAVVDSVMTELATRQALFAALDNRDEEGLLLLVNHLIKYITIPRHTRLMVQVAHRLLDQYTHMVGLSPELDHRLSVLKERVREEIHLQDQLAALQGALEPVIAAALEGARD